MAIDIEKPRMPIKGQSLDERLALAQIHKLDEEAKAYKAERKYHQTQRERLLLAQEEEDASLPGQRVYDFTNDVHFGNVRHAINTLTEWQAKDPETPITFRILTFGGDLFAGLAMYDAIRVLNQQGTPVDTQAIGVCASAGMILLQAGRERQVTENAWLMMHEIASQNYGKLSEMIDEVKWTKRAQQRVLEIMAERSHLSSTQIKRRWTRTDWWLEAEEAVKVGFADRVI